MGLVQLLAIFLGLLLTAGIAEAQDTAFTESFEVTRTDWYAGQDVLLRFERCNSSSSPATRCQTCFPEESVKVFSSHGVFIAQHAQEDVECIPEGSCRTWQSGECSSQSFRWPQIEGKFPPILPVIPNPASPGIYYAQIEFDETAIRTREFQLHGSSQPIPMIGGAAIATLVVFLIMIGGYRSARRFESRSSGQKL